jgi:hypothetical protein
MLLSVHKISAMVLSSVVRFAVVSIFETCTLFLLTKKWIVAKPNTPTLSNEF